ncbi:MAG: DsbA family protein [Saprospiraceae bacterium]
MKDYTIIYVYDALCGWCYGFSPVMQQLHEKYKDQIDFTVLSGGMVTGNRVGPIGQVAGYISDAYKTVEEYTGVKFGEGFLNGILKEGKAIFNSVPPSIALTVFKSYQPENAVAFASALQKAIYYDGIEPQHLQAYGKYAADFGIEPKHFVFQLQQNQFIDATIEEFKQVAEWGIQGFPSVIMATPEKLYLIARGYKPFEPLDEMVQQVLAEKITT